MLILDERLEVLGFELGCVLTLHLLMPTSQSQ